MNIPLKTYLESIPGFFGIRTEEEPSFKVLQHEGSFEVRQYESTVQALTLVPGSRDEAMDEGFRRLAGYIFGENSKSEQFSMTTPVYQNRGETLSMTTPVLQNQKEGQWEMAFVLPSHVTEASAPVPRDSRIEIKTIPSKTVATLRYSGNQDEQKNQEKAKELLDLVRKNGYIARSEVFWAQYDQPFAIPFLKRNEAHVEVERST
jgi:SOUL heme-binding protein